MLTKNQKRDQEIYFKEEGDPGFSPERNKAIIDKTIKKYEARRKKAMDDRMNEYGERADAVVSYIRAIDRGKESKIDKYFGKRYLGYLRGEEIKQQLMANTELRTPEGIIIKRKGQELPFK